MKNVLPLFLLVVLCLAFIQSPDPLTIIPIESKANQTVSVTGDLRTGEPIADMSFAWNSSVACFPATQKNKFTGHQVLYTTELPSYSEMEVKVIPDNKKDNFSIYAYQIGLGEMADIQYPPSSCVRCEVDHKWDRPWVGKTQNHTRTAKHLVAIRNPYRVVIGVLGAEGLSAGAYTLEVSLKSR